MSFMIYGATGYTGRLALERAVELGLKPIAAGRSADQVSREALHHGLDARACTPIFVTGHVSELIEIQH